MQKKHLRGLLLIFLLIGCGGHKTLPDNPYLAEKKAIEIDYPVSTPAPFVLWGPVEIRLADQSLHSEPFVFQVFSYTDGEWLGGLQVDGFDLRSAQIHRSLTSLVAEDSAAGLTCSAVPLPNGTGIVFYLEGETFSPVTLNLSRDPQDTLFVMRKKDRESAVFMLEDSAYCAVNGAPGFEDSPEDLRFGFEFHRGLKTGKRRQVVLAFAAQANQAATMADIYRKLPREELEAAVMDSLNGALAFSLLTEDERANRAFALLSVALAQAQPRLSLSNPTQIEAAAALAPALFLSSRQRSAVAFASNAARNFSQRVRWGSEAYRAALAYGMAGDDSLKQISLDVLADAARLNGEYSSNLFALGDEAIEDTMLRLAVAHTRYASLLAVCGDIAHSRGDRDAENSYRRDANHAGKEARRYFKASGALFNSVPIAETTSKLEMLFADDIEEDDESTSIMTMDTLNPPDTMRFLQAGAHYGFAWLADKPLSIAKQELDGLTWQRWVAYRFATDFHITETPDLDSVITLVLEGPRPGVLTEDPGHVAEPSPVVMGAALENLAELYLGFHPNWMEHRLDFEPRPPQKWGRTASRIPFGTGFITLDYDFGNERATISMSGIDKTIDVFFGYPLPTGSFQRIQFALSPEEPHAFIKAERDSENRVKLSVKNKS